MHILFAGGAAIAVAMLILALRIGGADLRARARVHELRDETRFGLPMEQAGARRVTAGDRVLALVTGIVPPRLVRAVAAQIARAGMSVTPTTFLAGWMAAVVATVVAATAWVATATSVAPLAVAMLTAVLAAVTYGPWFWLRRKATARTRSIDRALPQVLDIIVTNIECGLGLQAAMLVIAQKFTGPIATEFSRAMREISIGVPREEALGAMALRTGSADVAGVARSIAQGERTGVSISEILRARARELRERRRVLAREQANKIPVKLTIPMVFFTFPTFFILLIGPVAINAVHVMSEH